MNKKKTGMTADNLRNVTVSLDCGTMTVGGGERENELKWTYLSTKVILLCMVDFKAGSSREWFPAWLAPDLSLLPFAACAGPSCLPLPC